MSAVVGAVPGLVAAATAVAVLHGYRLLRSDPADGLDLDDLVLLRGAEQKRAKGQGPLGRLATRLTPSLRRRLPPAALRWLQRQVDLAGRPAGIDVDSVLQRCVMWALLVSPAFLIFLLRGRLIGLLLCVVCPLVLPLASLAGAARRRRERLDRDLPDFLDVLAVTVGAGVAFRSALALVSSRFGGPLAEEFSTALHQIANGATVRRAFLQLRDRNDSEALGEFVTAYLQSEELGAPLVDTLNHIADDMRRASSQRQRQRAAKVAPRVTLVSSVVLVPGALVILMVGMYLGADVDLGDLFG